MSNFEQSRKGMPDFHAIVAVAEHGSFRRAARALGVSPSALSHAVAAVEERLGVLLFRRTTRSVTATEAGQRFVARVRPALREIADAVVSARDAGDSPAGTLRINAPSAAVRRIFEPVVVPFVASYPAVHLDIVTEGRLVDVVAEGFDAGIRLAELVPRDMVSVSCSPPMRFVVVAAPSYVAEHGRPKAPSDLGAHRCIRRRMPSGAPLRWELARGSEAIDLDVDGPVTLDSDELVVQATVAGLGIGWVNEWSVDRLLSEQKLVTLLDDWAQPFPGLALYYPRHRQVTAPLRAFVDVVRKAKLARRRNEP
jgi:DNA-binding transcriptional LysR family regulator